MAGLISTNLQKSVKTTIWRLKTIGFQKNSGTKQTLKLLDTQELSIILTAQGIKYDFKTILILYRILVILSLLNLFKINCLPYEIYYQ